MPRKPKFSQAEKKALAKLKDKGLYKPKNPRKAPTAYAKKLLKQYPDVVAGKTTVIKANKASVSRFVSKDAGAGEIRAKGVRIIVPKGKRETVKFDKKNGDLHLVERGEDRIYYKRPFPNKPRSAIDMISQLRSGDYIAVPQWRGKKQGIGYNRYSPEEFIFKYVEQYGGTGSGGLDYALKHGMIDYSEEIGEIPVEAPLSRSEVAKANKRALADRMSEIMDRIIARRR